MAKLFAAERRQKILEFLNIDHRITVRGLADTMDVSVVTLRSDLKDMEKEGLLQRTHGGAVLPDSQENEINFHSRERKNKPEKITIANQAVSFVEDGHCILLDASSTALELARLLKDIDKRLTVVTSGIYTALELRENPELTVILLGGVVRHGSSSLEGVLGVEMLNKIHVDIMFTSANGFTVDTGLTDFNVYEVDLKKQMVAKAYKVAALVDFSKINKSSISSFASLSDIDYLISDCSLPEDITQQLNNQNVEVIFPSADT
ncbi:DeoR/GlpR family DNA-binding transcription regulator [Salibacterium halotolerans]|uniref:DNA-binding transcriptional regulator of sugar metabolism, DeoR/GlpR family n=1 Tax=Salibacterium halotolerans TaxID=1884432 RepID=A0A1I5PLD1_9BACI|nr:DeoR/GlpR family DNA-binding transcription regulator [Salibacterium halotolerans]SFP34864.1 DNA-binding transcriptional regulator of sugar metabolism, DeoR/GlpR family [Salibacterium halotolerans]